MAELTPTPIPNPYPQSLVPRIRSVGNALVAALLAPSCAVCEAVLDEPLRGCVCRSCWSAIRPITPPLCDRCGDPLPRPTERVQTLPLPRRHHRPGTRDRRIRGRSEIHHSRAQVRRAGVRWHHGSLHKCERADRELLDEADCVVPVPLHWRREYQRGFNQARELARFLGLPVIDALVRTRHTRPQVELAADRRRHNVEAAFAPRRRLGRKPSTVVGLKVVLVDDVSTTGATLESLRESAEAGRSHSVYALTAARVITRRP